MITPLSIAEVVAAVAQLGSALAIGAGVWVAHSQLNAWRQERLGIRRSEVAEELLLASMRAEDALRDIRHQLDSIPMDKLGDKVFPYQQRYDRLVSYNQTFRSLRDAQIKARAVFNDEEVDQAVETLLLARSKVAIAIEILADYARDDENNPNDREHKSSLKRDMLGGFNERDELGQSILVAVGTIQSKLSKAATFQEIGAPE